jgi:CRP/FNR family transcriptional regulator, cyclic AMP receptor protein
MACAVIAAHQVVAMVPSGSDHRPWPPGRSARRVGLTYLIENPGGEVPMTEVAALSAHPFLHGISPDHLALIATAASEVTFPAGRRLFEDGGSASGFWLIRSGQVALDLHVPGEGHARIDTIGMGELLGWSWLFPPYQWSFGAVAVSPVGAFEFDGQAVRASFAADPELELEVTQRVARVLAKRLQSTRAKLIGASVHPVGTR